jgi:hypothetical protein
MEVLISLHKKKISIGISICRQLFLSSHGSDMTNAYSILFEINVIIADQYTQNMQQ